MSSGPGDGAPEDTLPTGHVVGGRYELGEVLGAGATGTVYDARDRRAPDGHGRVALKVLHRRLLGSPQVFQRFRREARILALLEGEHLVRLLDFVEGEDLLALALERVPGRPLDAWMAEARPLPIETAVEIMLQVSAALGVAHAAGVVHRDLKPANVLIEARPGLPGEARPHLRVVDFGLAKVVHGEKMATGLTEHDMIFGTPAYMAPEQARGEDVDLRADLYAAGVMLYELVCGRVPFRARTPMAVLTAHLTESPMPPRAARAEEGLPGGLSPALEVVVLRALAKERTDRYPSARAFAEALAATLAAPRIVASVPAPGADAAALASSDTELHLERPAPPAAGAQASGRGPARGAAVEGHASPGPPSVSARTRSMFWAAAALALLVAAIAGAAIGAR